MLFVEPVVTRDLPAGRVLDLPGRGRTWILDSAPGSDAPAVVLLHGLGATAGLNWAGAFAALTPDFRVVALDQRGHGRGIRTSSFHLVDCADDVAALIDELGLSLPLVAGYSMGGPVACLVARRHPGLVGGLVLAGTSRNFSGRPAEKLSLGVMALLGWVPVSLPSPLAGAARAVIGATPHWGQTGAALKWAAQEMTGHEPMGILQAAGELGRFNGEPWLSDLDVPTSVVATMQDQVVPLGRQVQLARTIPGAELYWARCGHLWPAGPDKDRFHAALVDACRSTWSRAIDRRSGAPTPQAGADLAALPVG